MNGKEGSGLSDGNYVVVSYDLDTTGRRLIDEIVQIGAHCLKQGKDGESENCSYSQYVMPHRNPKPAAKRAYGFAVVNIGRSRMLKDIHSGQILKTKSEITALQSFLVWLEEAKGDSDGIILVSHEQNPKILVPLLIQSLARYNLVPAFSKIVKGFCNSANVIDKIGNKNEITSLSLRSLCKTVLQNTSLPTTTAIDRCQRVLEVLCSVAEKAEDKENKSKVNLREVVRPFATTIVAEEDNLKNLEHIESIQLTLRPIFGELLGGSWQLRERMVRVRRALAEKHLDYNKLKRLPATAMRIPLPVEESLPRASGSRSSVLQTAAPTAPSGPPRQPSKNGKKDKSGAAQGAAVIDLEPESSKRMGSGDKGGKKKRSRRDRSSSASSAESGRGIASDS